MLKSLKDHTATFFFGMIAPAASVIDSVTSDKFALEEKVDKLTNLNNRSVDVDITYLFGTAVGAVGGTAAVAAGLVSGVIMAAHQLADSPIPSLKTGHHIAGNANQGAQKLAEAAAVAGLIAPQFA